MYSVFNILKQNLCLTQSTQWFGEDKYVNTVNKSMKVLSARKYILYLYVKYPKNVHVCMYLCLHLLIYSPCHSYTHTHREIWIPDWFNDTHGENISEHFIPFGTKYMSNFGRQGGASEGVSEAPLAHKIHESNKEKPTGQRIILCYILAIIYCT